MELFYIQQIKDVMKWIVSVLCFLLVVLVAKSYDPDKTKTKIYERRGESLRERDVGIFDYESMRLFLLAHGAIYHFWKGINPVSYLTLRLAFGALLLMAGMMFHWIAAVLLAVLGFEIPPLLLMWYNREDNKKMMMQVMRLYATMQSQLRTGVYVTDALREVYDRFPKGRLRSALEDFDGEFVINKDFNVVLNHFNEKFKNTSIDSLCVILKQAQESGRAVELLGDMSKELENMKAVQLATERNALHLYVLCCSLGIALGSLMGIFYELLMKISEMGGALL